MIGCFVQWARQWISFVLLAPVVVFAVGAERPANDGFPHDPVGRDYETINIM